MNRWYWRLFFFSTTMSAVCCSPQSEAQTSSDGISLPAVTVTAPHIARKKQAQRDSREKVSRQRPTRSQQAQSSPTAIARLALARGTPRPDAEMSHRPSRRFLPPSPWSMLRQLVAFQSQATAICSGHCLASMSRTLGKAQLAMACRYAVIPRRSTAAISPTTSTLYR